MKVGVIDATQIGRMVTACGGSHCMITASSLGVLAIPIMSLEGIHDVYITEGTVNGDRFAEFVTKCLLPIIEPFNWTNHQSVVVMDNASIHHVDAITRLIERQHGARVCYFPPYSPDLMPAEGVFSQVKSIMKENHKYALRLQHC